MYRNMITNLPRADAVGGGGLSLVIHLILWLGARALTTHVNERLVWILDDRARARSNSRKKSKYVIGLA